MKTTTTLAAIAAALIAVSCTSDDIAGTPVATGKLVDVELTASQAATRVALNGTTLTWQAGDQLAVRYDDAAFVDGNVLTLSEGDGTATGTFRGQLQQPDGATNMSFYYPAAAASGEYDLTAQSAAGDKGPQMVMYAQAQASTDPTVDLACKTAIVKFDLDAPAGVAAATDLTGVLVNGCISRGTLGTDGNWSGTGKGDITLTDVTVAGGKVSGSFVVIPGTAKRDMVVVLLVGDKAYTSDNITAAGNIEAGKVYNLSRMLPVAWVPIEGGTFKVANGTGEYATADVTLSDYEISATEITNAQWVAFLNVVDKNGDSKLDVGIDSESTASQSMFGYATQYTYAGGKWSVSPGKANLPAAYVTWYGATSFAKHYGVKLMTECQFEYAAQKIEAIPGYSVGDYAWHSGNSGNAPHAVATKAGAAIGKNGELVYDLLGNIREWCQDLYLYNKYNNPPSDYPSGTQDPTGVASGTNRVARGGNWSDSATQATSSCRDFTSPSYTYTDTGFRIAR